MRNTERRVSPLATGRRKGPVSAEPSLFDAERTQKNLPFPFNKKKPIAKQAADPNRVAEAARAPGDKENNDGGGKWKTRPENEKKNTKTKPTTRSIESLSGGGGGGGGGAPLYNKCAFPFPRTLSGVYGERRRAVRAREREREREREKERETDADGWCRLSIDGADFSHFHNGSAAAAAAAAAPAVARRWRLSLRAGGG